MATRRFRSLTPPAALGGLLWLTACSTPSGTDGLETVAGLYSQGFEVDALRPCGSDAAFWVTAGEELRRRYADVAQGQYDEVFVIVRGERSARGRYGHLGAYPYTFAVRDVVEVRRTSGGACPPNPAGLPRAGSAA